MANIIIAKNLSERKAPTQKNKEILAELEKLRKQVDLHNKKVKAHNSAIINGFLIGAKVDTVSMTKEVVGTEAENGKAQFRVIVSLPDDRSDALFYSVSEVSKIKILVEPASGKNKISIFNGYENLSADAIKLLTKNGKNEVEYLLAVYNVASLKMREERTALLAEVKQKLNKASAELEVAEAEAQPASEEVRKALALLKATSDKAKEEAKTLRKAERDKRREENKAKKEEAKRLAEVERARAILIKNNIKTV